MIFNEFWVLFVLISTVVGWFALFGTRRYHHVINPLMLFAIFDIGVLTLLSVVIARATNNGQDAELIAVLYLVVVYIAGFIILFLPRRLSFPRQVFDGLLNVIGKKNSPAGFGGVSQLLLIMITIGLFFLLTQLSGAGILWITDPRLAYQSYRAGVGFIFMATQWALLASFVYALWTLKPQLSGLAVGVVLYCSAAYFTGSKSNILSGFVVAGAYYNFFINRISIASILCAVIIALSVFLTLLIVQGSYDDVFSAISYFSDYASTTGQFLIRFEEFELHWGYASLTDLWFYVPRSLYSGKPFEYGVVLIHKVLFPGAAELGATPGVLPWALAYLDFGVVGVFFSGVFTGIIRRGAYESFLSHRTNILAFLLMIQLSLIPVFGYATLPLSILIGVMITIFMRKKIVFFSSPRS